MARGGRFIIWLVVGLALIAAAATWVVTNTTRGWFERDLSLRAELAVNGVRPALSEAWKAGDRKVVRGLLTELARDERIMSVAACDGQARLFTSTADFPAQLGCERLAGYVMPVGSTGSNDWTHWTTTVSLPGGRAHLSALPIAADGKPLGFVTVVQDLSYVERRESQTRDFIFLTFAFLGIAASILTLVAARLSWRSWNDQFRRFLRGGSEHPEFQPLMRDVRELVQQISSEAESEGLGGPWTADRLRKTLGRQLQGERVIIVANREPYIHERKGDGIAVLHPASGLVTALEPVMRACSGVWVAHGSGTADRETADKKGRLKVPPGEESYSLRRVWLTPEQEQGYYYGFANEGLWPLCHIADARPAFRASDWQHYRDVNRKFAEAVCDEVDSDDPIILVQDYHFALAPRMIRDRLPRATIIAFWHIPWPNSERFSLCPWRNELLDGMLGASIVGFHTQLHCNNFIDAVDRLLEARIDREHDAVVYHRRTTQVRPYPISIEWPSHWASELPPPSACRAQIFGELGLREDALLGVGVDRLDYTKGIEERLLAVERLLERFPQYRGRFTFVQLAAPSRTVIEKYRSLNESVERLAARINGRFASGTYRPIVLLRAHHEPPTVFRYYRAADLCYVSSLHDGMNLVAKEFVASREDERGVLLLSQFTGAARELTESLIVNPYDIEEASAALASALEMTPDEQAERMRALRAFVSEFNVYRWAGRMLRDAARLRHRDRISDRLSLRVLRPVGVVES